MSAALFAAALTFGIGNQTAGSASEKDISAAAARNRIEDLKVGDALGTDGAVLDNKDDIKAGATVYASFKVEDLAVGTPVKAVWKGPGDLQLFSEVKPVLAGTRFMVFASSKTTNWKPGEYHVDIRIADELGGTEDFKIREAVVE